jgi:hypothetical protein
MGWVWVQAVGEGGVAPAGASGADGGGQGANHLDPVTPPHLPGGEAGSRGLPAGNFSSGLTSASPPGCMAQPTPTEGRSSVSTKQRENLEAVLRQSAFPVGSDVSEQRRDDQRTKREADPLLSRENLQARSGDRMNGGPVN